MIYALTHYYILSYMIDTIPFMKCIGFNYLDFVLYNK
jgi:hypothetical protein